LLFPGFREIFSRFPDSRFPFYGSRVPQIRW
jgi:hypothetical protein